MCSYKYIFLQSSSLRQGSTGVDAPCTRTRTPRTHTSCTHTRTPWTRARAHRANLVHNTHCAHAHNGHRAHAHLGHRAQAHRAPHTPSAHTPLAQARRAHLAHRAHAHRGPPRPRPSQRLACLAGLRVASSSGGTVPSAQLSTSAEWNEDRIWECGIDVLPRLETAVPDVYNAASLQSCRHSTPAETGSGNNVFICSGGCEHTHKVLSIQLSTLS